MTAVLRNRNLRIFLGMDVLSLTGSSALWLALAIWVKSLTGSTAAAGMVIFAILAPPVLLAPVAGMLVDRVRRRPLLVVVNLANAAAVALLLLVRDAGQLWLIYAVAALYGASWALLRSAQSALLRTVANDGDELLAANGALQTAAALSRLLSPIAGAGLYAAVGPHSVALLDAATFLVAAGGLMLLRLREPAPKPAEGHWRAEVAAGLTHLRRTVVLRQIVSAVALAMLVIGFIEVVMFAVVDQGLHRSPAFLGVLDLGFGAGSVAGGLLAATVVRRLGAGHAVTAGLAAVAIGIALLVVPVDAIAIGGLVVVGAGRAAAGGRHVDHAAAADPDAPAGPDVLRGRRAGDRAAEPVDRARRGAGGGRRLPGPGGGDDGGDPDRRGLARHPPGAAPPGHPAHRGRRPGGGPRCRYGVVTGSSTGVGAVAGTVAAPGWRRPRKSGLAQNSLTVRSRPYLRRSHR